MLNIHIYGLKEKEAIEVKKYIFQTLKEKRKQDIKEISIIIHSDKEYIRKPHLLLEGEERIEELKDFVKTLEKDIQIQPDLIIFYEKP